jgi:hypothetical protein
MDDTNQDELELRTTLPRRIENDLGFKTGRLRFNRRFKLTGIPGLTPEERKRLRAWAKGLDEGGLFVYNNWAQKKSAGLYKNDTVTIRKDSNGSLGWVASVHGISVKGSTEFEAAAKLSEKIDQALKLAELYKSVS